jgi:4'-phosphopantetheinyl transferase
MKGRQRLKTPHRFLEHKNLTSQRIYSNKLILKGTKQIYNAGLCLCRLQKTSDYLASLQHLHPQEIDYYKTLPVEKRKKSYSIGRYSAKKALSALVGEKNLKSTFIDRGLFNHPIVVIPNNQNFQVSISHCDDVGAALAFPEALPMGIDVERVDPAKKKVIESQTTEKEKELIKSLPHSYSTLLVLLWTAKEALSKILKTGLMTPFKISEISDLTVSQDTLVCNFKNFAQYKGLSFNLDSYMHTIVFPKNTEIQFDFNDLRNGFNNMESSDEQNIKDGF